MIDSDTEQLTEEAMEDLIDEDAGGLCHPFCDGGFGDCYITESSDCQGGCFISSLTQAPSDFTKRIKSKSLLQLKDNAYKLRDEFLINSRLGKKYIAYYYAISDALDIGDFDRELLIKIMEYAPKVNARINSLIGRNKTFQTSILIDEHFAKDIKDILDILSTKSNGSIYYTNIIEDLKSDVEYFSNKPKSIILNEIY